MTPYVHFPPACDHRCYYFSVWTYILSISNTKIFICTVNFNTKNLKMWRKSDFVESFSTTLKVTHIPSRFKFTYSSHSSHLNRHGTKFMHTHSFVPKIVVLSGSSHQSSYLQGNIYPCSCRKWLMRRADKKNNAVLSQKIIRPEFIKK